MMSLAAAAPASAADQEPDDDEGDDRQPREVEGVAAEQGEHRHDGEDGDRDDWHAGGPVPSGAGGGGRRGIGLEVEIGNPSQGGGVGVQDERY
jgi:hypothetical protein